MADGPDDVRWMRLAIAEANAGRANGEVPVGAVVVVGSGVVSAAHNAPIGRHDPTAHAEIVALRRAGERVENYRLAGATLYCTVEPCLMCLGAAIHARIDRLVYGAPDPKVGAASELRTLRERGAVFNHRFEIHGGVLEDEIAETMRAFFRERRDGRGR